MRRETVFFEPKVTDHSCDEILWNFRPDGYLSVNSNVQGLEHSSGEELRFEIIPISESRNFFILKIGSSRWPAGIIENKMTLNDAALDGPILEFIRIE